MISGRLFVKTGVLRGKPLLLRAPAVVLGRSITTIRFSSSSNFSDSVINSSRNSNSNNNSNSNSSNLPPPHHEKKTGGNRLKRMAKPDNASDNTDVTSAVTASATTAAAPTTATAASLKVSSPQVHAILFDYVYNRKNKILKGQEKPLFLKVKDLDSLGLQDEDKKLINLRQVAAKFHGESTYENQKGRLEWKQDEFHPTGYILATKFGELSDTPIQPVSSPLPTPPNTVTSNFTSSAAGLPLADVNVNRTQAVADATSSSDIANLRDCYPQVHAALFEFVYNRKERLLKRNLFSEFWKDKLFLDLGLKNATLINLRQVAAKFNSESGYEKQKGRLLWKQDELHPGGYLLAAKFGELLDDLTVSPATETAASDGYSQAGAKSYLGKPSAGGTPQSPAFSTPVVSSDSNNPASPSSSLTSSPAENNSNDRSESSINSANTTPPSSPSAQNKNHNPYVKPVKPTFVHRNNKDPAYLKEVIQNGRLQSKKQSILWAIHTARIEKIQLDMRDYMTGLAACTETMDERNVEAFCIYEILSKQKVVPIEVFNRVIRVCAIRGDAVFALRLMDDFKEMKYQPNPAFLSDLLIALARSENPEHVRTIESIYENCLKVCADNDVRISTNVLQEIALYFSLKSRSEQLIKVLEKMTELEIEPSVSFCLKLLDNSLECYDSRSASVLGNWFAKIFDMKLPQGTLARMMDVACYNSSPELAKICVQLHSKAELPLTPMTAYAWALACIKAPDFFSVIETLLECQSRGIDFYNEYSLEESEINDLDAATVSKIGIEQFKANKRLAAPSLGERLYLTLAERLSQTRKLQDEFYYALVDMVRADAKVPKILLDASVLAPGFHAYSNKSFATFQEYKTLFGLNPDVHSYNGLLTAIAFNRISSVHDMFKILQQMEKEKIFPNVMTFSVLLEFLAHREETSIIESTLQHAIQQGILPDRKASFRLVKHLRIIGGANSSSMDSNSSSNSSNSSNSNGSSIDSNKSEVTTSEEDPAYESMIKTISQLSDIRLKILNNPAHAYVFPDKRLAESRKVQQASRIPISRRPVNKNPVVIANIANSDAKMHSDNSTSTTYDSSSSSSSGDNASL